jgi:cytoskeletal protein RodZ
MNRPIGPRQARGLVALIALVLLVGLVALPVLAADPTSTPPPEASPSAEATPSTSTDATESPTSTATETPAATPTASATESGTTAPAATDATEPAAPPDERSGTEPDGTGKPDKSSKPEKAAKGPEIAATVTGTVGTTTDGKGRTHYTLTTGATVRELSAGPPWFFGDDHPLKPFVGKQVTVVGTQRAGDDEVDVVSVNGTALREPGRPPWAGGWKVVGENHPGWSQEKWDRWQAKIADQAAKHGTDCWPPGHCKDKPAGDDTDGD